MYLGGCLLPGFALLSQSFFSCSKEREHTPSQVAATVSIPNGEGSKVE
jgi:pantothenate kinase type III